MSVSVGLEPIHAADLPSKTGANLGKDGFRRESPIGRPPAGITEQFYSFLGHMCATDAHVLGVHPPGEWPPTAQRRT